VVGTWYCRHPRPCRETGCKTAARLCNGRQRDRRLNYVRDRNCGRGFAVCHFEGCALRLPNFDRHTIHGFAVGNDVLHDFVAIDASPETRTNAIELPLVVLGIEDVVEASILNSTSILRCRVWIALHYSLIQEVVAIIRVQNLVVTTTGRIQRHGDG
jgi:hypothetical protein